MSVTPSESIETAPPPGDAVTWTCSPARDRPGRALAGLLVVGLFGALVGLIGGDWIWGAFAVVFLLATLSRFYLASRISIDGTGIRAEFPLRTRFAPWDRIRSIRHDDVGALIRVEGRGILRSREFTILFGDRSGPAVEALERHAPAELLERTAEGARS